jgi:HK97 family phage portal protein
MNNGLSVISKTKRIITGQNSTLDNIIIKDSSGFIEDLVIGKTIQPALVKVRDTDAWSLYKGSEWIFSTVNRIVSDTVKAVPHIVPKDKTKKISGRLAKRIQVIKDFLDNPNDNKESFNDIRQKVIRDKLVYGRATIEKILNPINRGLLEIYAQDPKYIKIAADEHGNMPSSAAYVLQPPSKKEETYDIDQMIFMVHIPVSNSLYGVKTIDAIANTVAADILRAVYNSRFFVNNGEAGGIISLEGMNKTDLKKFRDMWNKEFKGAKNAHKTAAVNVPIEYVRMAITNRDLQFSEYGSELRGKIFAAYGMQPFIMGIVDGTSGKLNSKQQVELYKDGALRPLLEQEAYYYTHEIIQMGFKFNDIEITFPTIDLSDIETQTNLDRQDAEAGILVINEIRARRGLGEVPWGNTPVSLAPGGGQVDPNTGRIIPPSAQGNKKPKKSLLDKYINSVKIKLSSILESELKDNLPTPNIEEMIKLKQIYINGKNFDVKFYTLPTTLTKTILHDILDSALDPSYLCEKGKDVRFVYFESIASKIKYVVFINLIAKTITKIETEIDMILYEEKNSSIFFEVF